VDYLNTRATRDGWQGRFQVGLLIVLTLACLGAAGAAAHSESWPVYGALLLFLGLLTLINAPFDWFALGLTRALLRRGLELGKWFPYALAAADALAAAAVIALLTVACVLGVQTFDDLAAHAGGPGARILPLDPSFDGIAANPTAPEYWWVYAMLLSTMIPSLLNLMIGGASLLRGVPWITTALLRAMPEHRALRSFDQAWIALVLTAQVFLGGLLGIAAQAFLVYVVIGLLLPVFGLDLLGLARAVAAPDLPGTLIHWLLGPGSLEPAALPAPWRLLAQHHASAYFPVNVSPRTLEPDRLTTHRQRAAPPAGARGPGTQGRAVTLRGGSRAGPHLRTRSRASQSPQCRHSA